MTAFIRYIVNFTSEIYNNIFTILDQQSNNYGDFLSKQIIGGTLLNIGLTWRELFRFISVWFLVIFFIILVFKIVLKVIGLFRL